MNTSSARGRGKKGSKAQANGSIQNTVEEGASRALHTKGREDAVPRNKLAIRSEEQRDNEMRLGMQEISSIIPEFRPGANSLMTAADWLKLINNLRHVYNWSEHRVLLYATMRLKGAASYWYQSKQEIIGDWEQFQVELLKSFPEAEDDSLIHFQIMSRKRKAMEPIENYFYEIIALSKRARLQETTIINYIIGGLGDRNLMNILTASSCQTTEELLRKIKQYEGIELQEKNRRQLQRKSNYPDLNFKPLQRHAPGEANTVRTGFKTTGFPQRTWTNTNSVGKFRTPSDKDVCYRCGKRGHRKRNCNQVLVNKVQNTGSDRQNENNSNQVRCISAENNELYKTISIQGKALRAFIDLGSDCCTIQSKVCKEYEWTPVEKNIMLKGFGGGTCRAKGCITRNVKIGDVELKTELLVVDNDAQDVPVIIGQTFLNQPGVKVIKSWEGLKIISENYNIEQVEEQISSKQRKNQGEVFTLEDVNVSIPLKEYSEEFINLINKYKNCFALNNAQLGKTKTVEMKINLKREETVRYKPYRVPYLLESELTRIISDLKESNIIEPSTSEYSSPALLVKKKDGSYRMCIDYRKINSITKKEYFPTPNIEEQLNKIAKGKVFISLDFMSGYYQIVIEPQSRKYTAFVTPDGQYQFIRMPFGLCNAPAVFMRLMKVVLERTQCDKIFAFMDDILIAAESIQEALLILEKLLKILEEENLTLNLKKCVFFTETVTYLGHRINNGKLQPGSRKLTAINEYKEPTNVKEVRQFLGLTGYFRKFISKYADIAQPLNKLLKKDQKFEWTNEQRNAFKQLKERLSSEPVLELYKPDLKHELHTDACSKGLAGMLLQIHGDGSKHVVSYFSRATTEAEQKYHSFELEALAVVESLERFKYYLQGKHFKIITDCNSLKMTQEKNNIVPRIARWWLRIQEYDFEIEHRPGTKMRHIDALSRSAVTQGEGIDEVCNKIMVTGSVETDWVVTLQARDRTLKEIKDLLETEEQLKPEQKHKITDYQLKRNRVYRKTQDGLRLVVPHGFRWNVIRTAHEDTGHGGIDRTIQELQKTYWFARMRDGVKKYTNNCIDCLYNKRFKDETRYHLHAREIKAMPFHSIHIDHLGPYAKSSKGNTHLIGIVDAFSKFVILKPVRNTSTRYVTLVLEEMSQYFGLPQIIISDRGSAFTSKTFNEFCEKHVIQHIKTAVKTPRANGQIERYFRTIGTAIATTTQRTDGKDWDKQINTIQWGLNSRIHRVTGQSPQQVILGYQPKGILGNKLAAAVYVDLLDEQDEASIQELRKRVAQKINENAEKVTRSYNIRKPKPQTYQQGDLILIRSEPASTGYPRKHLPKYKGPYIIEKVVGNDRYLVSDPPGVQVSGKSFQSVYSADRIRPWCQVEDFELAEMELVGDVDEE